MGQSVQVIYYDPKLQIGVVDWRRVYLLHPIVTLLLVEVDKGRLSTGQRVLLKESAKERIKKEVLHYKSRSARLDKSKKIKIDLIKVPL